MAHALDALTHKPALRPPQLFADGADLATITELAEDPTIDGFTTNPTLLRKAGVTDYEGFARAALEVVGDRPISFEVFADEPAEIARQARMLAGWGDGVFVKVPVTTTDGRSTHQVVADLAADGVQLNVTALMTPAQVEVVSAALAGGPRSYISLFAGRVADAGIDPLPIMAAAVAIMAGEPAQQLIWASPREVLNYVQAAQVGCHVITMTSELISKLPTIGKDLDRFSLETVAMFRNDARSPRAFTCDIERLVTQRSDSWRTGMHRRMPSPKAAGIRAAKSSVLWLRDRRRLERVLAKVRVDGDRSLYSHRLLAPTATLSPWYDDPAFMAAYEAVADHTLVDIYRCWDLWSGLAQVAELPGDVLEVGVWRGGTGALLAERARGLGLDATVILADTFHGVVGAGSADPWYRGGEHADTSADVVRSLLKRFPGTRAELAVGVFPDETGDALRDRTLRMVHIDVDVYNSALATLTWAWPRLGVGGLVVFDDYGSYECEGVATLGTELMARAGTALRGITSLNGHLTLVKVADEALPALEATQ